MHFLGKVLGEKQAGPFRITETAYSANAVLAMHQHESAYFSFVLSGSYVEFPEQEKPLAAQVRSIEARP